MNAKSHELFSVSGSSSEAQQSLWQKFSSLFVTNDGGESTYKADFENVDLSDNFFFSYTYDLTKQLQRHAIAVSETRKPPMPVSSAETVPTASGAVEYNTHARLSKQMGECDMFLWNHYIGFHWSLVAGPVWCVPLIHGSFQQVTTHTQRPALTHKHMC